MYVCLCNGITEKDLQRHIAEGACCLEDLACCAGIGTGCGRCREAAAIALAQAAGAASNLCSLTPAEVAP